MVPDLPYFVPAGFSREQTHSWLGVVTADLGMGLVALALWVLVFQAPLRDFAPAWLRLRLPPVRNYHFPRVTSAILLPACAIVVGTVTHLIWDSFTHPDGWIVQAMPALQSELGHFTLYRWMQYGSSAAGLAVVLIWLVLWVRRTPRASGAMSPQKLGIRARYLAWTSVALPGLAVGSGLWVHGLLTGVDAFDRVLVFRTATLSISCAGLVAVVLTLAWYLVPQQRNPAAREPA